MLGHVIRGLARLGQVTSGLGHVPS